MQSKYTDCELLFFSFITALLAGIAQKRTGLVLVIDGTDLGKHCGALMISVVVDKRALPLVWLVKEGNKGHFSAAAHVCLVQPLKSLLPACKKLILLGGCEFDSWDLQAYALSQGWSYVFRTAKNTVIEDSQCDSYAVGELCADSKTGYLLVENFRIGRRRKGRVNVLEWHKKGEKAPIYLLSNFEWAKNIITYYRRRWGIKTLFGDLKSRGFPLHKTRVKKPEMLCNLLILVAIAFCLCFIVGLAEALLKDISPKILRQDRLESYSIFHIGKKLLEFCIQKIAVFISNFAKF